MQETTISPENPKDEKPYNLEPNVEAAFAYFPLIGIFTSLAIFMVEKENKFIKFHALQGIFLGIIFILLNIIFRMTFILTFLLQIINFLAFVLWGFMIWKAYNNEEFELPLIGKIAHDQIK